MNQVASTLIRTPELQIGECQYPSENGEETNAKRAIQCWHHFLFLDPLAEMMQPRKRQFES